MEYLHLIWQLPAIVAGTTMLAYVSPWKIQPRFMPLLMFIIGMIVLTCPAFVSLALGLTIPAAYLQSKLGIDLHSHEPLKITLPQIRKPQVLLREFAARAYPSPADEAAGQDTSEVVEEHDPEDPPKHEPGSNVTVVPNYVPPL